MAVNTGNSSEGTTRSWPRKHMPTLMSVAMALALLLIVLPNALTLPNTNPNEVPEYAPVPPQDDEPPPQQSNISSLSLGSTSGIVDEVKAPEPKKPQPSPGQPTLPPLPPPGDSSKDNPTIYDCVAGHQTEDPLSPPCSPFFSGDNGGATYAGVTKDEIRFLYYMDGSQSTAITTSYDGTSEVAPLQGTYCDADAPPNSDPKCANENGVDHMYVRLARAYSRYLNARFQTYGRHIHFWVYYSGAGDAGGRRSDATDNFNKIKPFGVIDFAIFQGFSNAYVDAMARNGVLIFSSEQVNPREFYNSYDPLVWSFFPDVEHMVDTYVEWVCKKVAAYPVSHSGAGTPHGGPRKYAFYATTDPGRPDLLKFKELAIPRLKKCIPGSNNSYPQVKTFPVAGYTVQTGGDALYARQNVADLKGQNITTLLWLGGVDGKTEQAGDELKYYPEVFYAGDRYMEGNATGFYANRNFHTQIAVVTPVMREDRVQNTAAYQAWRQAEPNAPDDPEASWVGSVYRDYFMVGMAVQVAGPRLHPATVAEGFRAIPAISSNDPFTPACFFKGTHFCVQDATQEWWDGTGTAPGASDPSGCYRMPEEGRRFTLGKWPKGDEVFVNKQDPCTAYSNGARFSIGTPSSPLG